MRETILMLSIIILGLAASFIPSYAVYKLELSDTTPMSQETKYNDQQKKCLDVGAEVSSWALADKQFCYGLLESKKSLLTKQQKAVIFTNILMWYSNHYIANPSVSDFDARNAMSSLCYSFRKDNNDFKEYCNANMVLLALMYFQHGQYNMSYIWFNRSNPLSDSTGTSQFYLGYMYDQGIGTTQDLNKALYWYKQAIKYPLVSDITITNIAYIYLQENDYQTAFSLFLKEAKLGSSASQYGLAKMYQNGLGTIQDSVEAYAWASVAVANGFKQEDYPTRYAVNQNTAIKFRDALGFVLLLEDKSGKKIGQAKNLAKKYYQLYVLNSPSLK